MIIHTIGDSHAVYGWRHIIPVIHTHHLGGILCHSFGKDPHGRCDFNSFGINDGDTVVFSFGEIDCRCHVHKHLLPDKSYRTIIDELIVDYFAGIKAVVGDKQIRICIYNIVPPVHKIGVVENPDFPYLGTDEERLMYVTYFNEKLAEMSATNNYIFIRLHEFYADSDGFLRMELSDGIVHVKDPYGIVDFINKNLCYTN